MIKVIYNKVCGRCVQSEPLTSGMVGQPIEFEYSPDFDGLTLTAVFTNGKTTVDVLNPGNQCVIPHEVLDTVGTLVKVGVYAVRGNELVIPTVYAAIGVVQKGADPSGDVSIDPTLPVWAQTQALIGNLNDLTTEAKNNLVAAINEAAQTGGGGSSTVELDTTLTQSGKAADAKAVGDALAGKQDKLIAGDNITIAADGKTISATGGGGGLSSSERSTLIAVVNAIGAFNVNNGQELIDAFNDAWVQKIPTTGITLSAASLSFTAGTSQALTATVEPSDSTDTVVWSSSNPAVATVSNGVVTPVANGDCVITATAGSVSASCAVNVAFAEEVVYYTITNNLTNCTSDNSAASVVEGGSYTATITANDGYTLDGAAVSVVVNGEDVTDTAYANGVITIPSVTGNVVITVSAVEVSAGGSDDIVMLASITGDGASWIDTEVLPEATHRYEISATVTGTAPEFFVGCDMYNVGSSYGSFYVNVKDTVSIAGCLNRNTFTNVGTWNKTEANLLTNKQVYFVIKNGSQKIYLDAEYTTQQSNVTNGTIEWGSSLNTDIPIIPIHLFHVNYTSDTSPSESKKYTPTTTKFFWFKIYDDSTNELLHDFRPAKQGSKIGMYDTVTNKFHENIGTGTFSYEEVAA